MPSFLPVCMMPGSMNVFASRIVFATAGVFTRISIASMRPLPSMRGTSCWLMMPRNDSLTMILICSR